MTINTNQSMKPASFSPEPNSSKTTFSTISKKPQTSVTKLITDTRHVSPTRSEIANILKLKNLSSISLSSTPSPLTLSARSASSLSPFTNSSSVNPTET